MSIIRKSLIKSILSVSIVIIGSFNFSASAQSSSVASRVAIVTNENKTTIWVSDFPKKTSVVITDADNNLLSIITTNDYGAAFLSLPTAIKTLVTVKTLDGEIVTSNKAVIKATQQEPNVVATQPGILNKV